jgi:RNA-binding protein YhbY
LLVVCRAIDTTIKIGRRGATPGVVSGVQQAWRGHEVVKLRIHDDKVRLTARTRPSQHASAAVEPCSPLGLLL